MSIENRKGFIKPQNRYEAKQEDFSKISGSPVAYWASDKVKDIFSNDNLINDIQSAGRTKTHNDEKYLRFFWECEKNKQNVRFAHKGGEAKKWYGNLEYFVNWSEKAKAFYKSHGGLRNPKFEHTQGITWGMITSGKITFRLKDENEEYLSMAPTIIPKKEQINYLLSFLNSNVCDYISTTINITLGNSVGNILNIPFINHSETININKLTQQNIDISKEEWDSRETSWDFTKNELIKHKSDNKIETAYSNYCNYWKERHNTLHKNEEELNRLFIDIYELQDELTSKVELKDITILKQESKINDNNELEFNAGEIIKQFISYAVGVMFGRYSLEEEGLVVANLNQDYPKDATFRGNFSSDDETAFASFEIDDDNIIPVLEDDFFTDDIASRFTNFVKVVFGEDNLSENIDFIEKSLGTTIRKYFVKGFYEDHIKRYKKRPIYWMVSSPKKGFNTLIYMHRYRSDIFATIQNDYLREYITKLESNIENLQRIADDESNSNSERNKASKEITKSNKILDEIIQFDRNALTRFAQDGIDIDLDDGVKVNYCKFKDVLYPITGLCK